MALEFRPLFDIFRFAINTKNLDNRFASQGFVVFDCGSPVEAVLSNRVSKNMIPRLAECRRLGWPPTSAVLSDQVFVATLEGKDTVDSKGCLARSSVLVDCEVGSIGILIPGPSNFRTNDPVGVAAVVYAHG